MSITLQPPKLMDLQPRLTVIGVGGAGCNAINNMIAAGLTGVEFVVANTDAQALQASSAEHRIQLGAKLTEGLGAGAEPAVGQAAAEESVDDIRAQISGSHMVFVAAGMGGGTGTGAAAVVARTAREMGILTVGVVTRPFQFEGSRRLRTADRGIDDLKANVDTLIVIPNQNLFRIANEKTTFAEAFVLADQVLYSGVACIVDLIIKEGLINLDFADVRAVMSGMGTAMMGTGEASGDRRAIMAAEEAIANPLLDDVKLKGAQGVLLSITGGPDMTLFEVDEAASRVRQDVDPEANIIVGATFDDSLDDRIRVSIVASGMHADTNAGTVPSQTAESRGAQVAATGQDGTEVKLVPAPPPLMAPPPQDTASGAAQTSPAIPPAGAATLAAAAPATPPLATPDPAQPLTSSDLQQRLSEAMHHRPETAAPSAQAQPSAPAPATWQAPGNVTIIEGGPPPASAQAPRPPAAVPPQPTGAPTESVRTFQPQRAADVPRSGPGGGIAMPGLEQFPVVGQRAYQAHHGGQAGAHPTAAGPHFNGAAQPGVTSDRPKRGLFERLAGLGRSQNESVDSRASTHAAAPVSPPVPHGYGPDGNAADNSDSNSDDPNEDLPVFFNAKGR